MIHTVFFFITATLILFSAYFVVTARNLFRCAISLIAVLLGMAGLYLLMNAQFLSAIQIMVYIGGIVVLIVFVILLVADVVQKTLQHCSAWRKGMAGLCVAALFALITYGLLAQGFEQRTAVPAKSATIEEIGRALLSPKTNGFILPFEVISLVLIAALIGAITVARSEEHEEPHKENPS